VIGAELGSEELPSPPLSFDDFYASERRRLFGTLVLMSGHGDVADDITQEAFVRILERWDKVAGMESPNAYLYRTALNLLRTRGHWARRWSHRTADDTPMPDIADAVASKVAVWRALDSLTSQQRVSLVLVDLAGFTAEEAASVLGVEGSAVRARLHRARERLRQELITDG
jgi:RNA polymerase sigma-70 factor, ECF subfamily